MANTISWIVLVLALSYTLAARFAQLDTPLERDEGEYALMGQLMLDGVPLYREAANMKFPGVYASYACAFLFFGQTVRVVHLLTMAVVSVSLITAHLLSKKIAGPTSASLTSLSLAVLLNNPYFLSFAGHAAHFVVLWSILGLALYRFAPVPNSTLSMLFVGLLLGMSGMMKQHGYIFLSVPLATDFYRYYFGRQMTLGNWLSRQMMLLVGASIPLLVTLAILSWAGVLDDFWFWTVTYAREYTGLISIWRAPFDFVQRLGESTPYLSPLLLLGGFGALSLIFDKRGGDDRVFLFSFFLAGFISILPGFFFRSHYFLQVAIPFALLLSAGITRFAESRLTNRPILAFGITWIPILVVAGWGTVPFAPLIFSATPNEFSHKLYGHQSFTNADTLASFIVEHSEPTDKIAIIGSEPEILFLAHRRPAMPFLYIYPLFEDQPYAPQMHATAVRAIKENNPPIIMMIHQQGSWCIHDASHQMILDWLKDYLPANYTLAGWAPLHQEERTAHFLWGEETRRMNKADPEKLGIFLRKDLVTDRSLIRAPKQK